MRGMNPKKLKQMMKQMGIDIKEIEDVEEGWSLLRKAKVLSIADKAHHMVPRQHPSKLLILQNHKLIETILCHRLKGFPEILIGMNAFDILERNHNLRGFCK